MPGLGHIAMGVAAGRLHSQLERRPSPIPAMIAFSVLSAIHDADVIGFSFGIPYDAPFGHRGASHSIVAGLLLGLLAGWLGKLAGYSWGHTTAIACVVAVSHGLLDTFTDGGRGIALLWPLTNERFFSPWQPFPVSPLGMGLFSWWGLRVLLVELVLFLPLLVFAFWPRRRRRLENLE